MKSSHEKSIFMEKNSIPFRFYKQLLFSCLFSLLLLFFLTGCQLSGKKEPEQDVLSIKADSSLVMLRYRTNLFVIPSAHQTTKIIRDHHVRLDESLLNPVINAKRYTGSFQQAVNLGIYGTDAGYLSLFGNNQQALAYFAVIKDLIAELQLYEVMDQHLMDRIETHIDQPDSLIVLLAGTFRSIDNSLSESNRDAVAVLAITGGWVESVYLAFSGLAYADSDDFVAHLLNQKYPLEKLIRMLAPYYQQTPEITALVDDLTNIAYEFDCIDIDQHYQEPDLNTVARSAIIRHQTIAEMHGYDLDKLTVKITTLRNRLIQ